MKHALIVNNEVNQITDQPFDVAKPWYWAQCPDDVKEGYSYDAVKNKFSAPKLKPPTYAQLRIYPTYNEQLDMLYHDIKSGNLENGTWIAAIDAVKNEYPKPE